jgi:hypothetical protein
LAAEDEENPMQDLCQNYVDDVKKLREAFHGQLTDEVQELSQAMSVYAQNTEAALSLFMEKVSARSAELRTTAAARLDQFYGLLPAKHSLPNVSHSPLAPANADQARVTATVERALAESLLV